MTETLIFNVLLALITCIAGIIAKYLIPYLKEKETELATRIRQTQWAWAADIIEAVVRAVEQTVSNEIHGQDKKDIAIKYIEQILSENSIYLSADQIDKLIEAAVQAMNQNTIEEVQQ